MKNLKRFCFFIVAFIMMGLCAPAMAAVEDAGFSDVAADAAYGEAVVWCRDNGLLLGTSDTAFSPSGTLTRAMLATALYRAEGEPSIFGTPGFTDTDGGAWYSDAVVWANESGILLGYGGSRFGTDDPVTVEQLEVAIERYLGKGAEWTGDPARNIPATRAQIASALYEKLSNREEPSSGSKVLVVYFSRAGENYNVGVVEKGNTAIVAEIIAEQTGGDLFEIRPTTPYPSDYSEMLEVARQESSQNARPEIADSVENMADYDIVFLGYPVWNGDMPMIVYHFLETYDLSGKTVLPFSTNEGSGLAGTQGTISTQYPNAAVLDGLAILGQTAQNDQSATERAVETWLRDSGIFDRTPSAPDTPSQGAASSSTDFDLEKGTVTLNNGMEMPVLGIGTYTLSNQQAENSVYWALRDGYRLIDTARIYGNEEGVGRGIQRAIDEGLVTREEIFVTTKMWTSDYGNGAAAIDASLRRLGLDYIDLMILHHSQPGSDVAAYQAMEQAVSAGKLRSIGLSNYYTTALILTGW